MDDTWIYHPRLDEHGARLRLHAPSCEANLARLADPLAAVTFVPGSTCADMLHGVPFAPCTAADVEAACRRVAAADQVNKAEAKAVTEAVTEAVAEAVAEPPFVLPPGKRAAAGAVVREPDGRVWLVAPSNGFGGYTTTFPKGRVEPGVALQATAIREVWEESGLLVEPTAWLGDFSRTQTYTRFYVARRIGGHPADMGWESQAVHLVTPADAIRLLNRATDHAVLAALEAQERPGREDGAPWAGDPADGDPAAGDPAAGDSAAGGPLA
jgi:8-oxo-dGTP pyrophosphatase MutT (NUDIX family)